MKKHNVAIAGATGVVGRTFVEVLQERNFPVAELRLLASPKSVGRKIQFRQQEFAVELLEARSFENIDFALFSAGADVSREFTPIAAEAGATVIDNSSAFRMQENVPLVVPEVNAQALKNNRRIIANPNCSTIQLVVAAKPLHDAAILKRIVVSTYQAVSGKGRDAVEELKTQSGAVLENQKIRMDVFPHPIAFNALPHIDKFNETGDTFEEIKMVKETRKIMSLRDLPVSATCVRVPVFTGHSISLNLEFEKPLDVEKAREILSDSAGVMVMDNPQKNVYPTPVFAAGKDDVFVGRIRRDDSVASGLNLWVVSDNLRKGAALNAIQIAEALLTR